MPRRSRLLSTGVTTIAGAFLLPAELSADQAIKVAETNEEQIADILSFDQDDGARMTVPVEVVGFGPYPFLVDTGAERTVISKELARRLKLTPGPNVILHSMTEVAEVPTALVPALKISKRMLNDLRAPALSAVDMGAAGMLGVDSLQSHRVMFDFERETMSVVPSRKMQKYWGRNSIVIQGRSLYGHLVLMNAHVDGQKIIAIVDTGSPVSIGNNALRRRLAARKMLKPASPVELTSVTGGKLTVDYTTARVITLDGIDVFDMPIGFAEVHPFRRLQLTDRPALLLGMDVLQLFERVSVDFARKEIRLKLPGRSGFSEHEESISSRSRIQP